MLIYYFTYFVKKLQIYKIFTLKPKKNKIFEIFSFDLEK